MTDSDYRRFMSKFEPDGPDGCWLWTAGCFSTGYGQFHMQDSEGKNRNVGAHRVSYEMCKGKIPDGHFVRHTCDNPGCINPAHLVSGTPKQNSQDMVRRSRQASGERHGMSQLTEEEVLSIRASSLSQTELAQQYGVTQSTIWLIVHNKKWTHLN